jgi:hypothetical protein
MEILNKKFPDEISWSILKFISHPTADIMKSVISNFILHDERDFIINVFDGYRCGITFIHRNCIRCFKLKRNRKYSELYCRKCEDINWKEYIERCKSYGFGDGCD